MESMAMYRRHSSHGMGLLELGPLGLTGARLDLDDLPLVVADGDGLDVAQSRQRQGGGSPVSLLTTIERWYLQTDR